MSDDREWKLSPDEAQRYADQLRHMAARQERRALLAQELEGCAAVIVKQADRIAELEAELRLRTHRREWEGLGIADE